MPEDGETDALGAHFAELSEYFGGAGDYKRTAKPNDRKDVLRATQFTRFPMKTTLRIF
jgi:hypothetical protein